MPAHDSEVLRAGGIPQPYPLALQPACLDAGNGGGHPFVSGVAVFIDYMAMWFVQKTDEACCLMSTGVWLLTSGPVVATQM